MIKMKFTKKGQGALEYLILIGAAILVAVIVVTIIIGTSSSNRQTSEQTTRSYTELVTNTILPPMIISVDCNAASNVATYILNASVSADVNEYCVVQNDVVNITGCQALSNNNVAFTTTLDDGNSYRMSLVAGNGRAYSTPTSPAPTCIAHN
jgi:uncharacterized protein (UPF0333 family)